MLGRGTVLLGDGCTRKVKSTCCGNLGCSDARHFCRLGNEPVKIAVGGWSRLADSDAFKMS